MKYAARIESGELSISVFNVEKGVDLSCREYIKKLIGGKLRFDFTIYELKVTHVFENDYKVHVCYGASHNELVTRSLRPKVKDGAKDRRKKSYTFNGKEMSLLEASVEIGIGYDTLRGKLKMGMTLDGIAAAKSQPWAQKVVAPEKLPKSKKASAAKNKPKKPKAVTANLYEYKGQSLTMKQLELISPVSATSIRRRIDAGYSVEVAVDSESLSLAGDGFTKADVQVDHNKALKRTERLLKENRQFARCAARHNL